MLGVAGGRYLARDGGGPGDGCGGRLLPRNSRFAFEATP